MCQKRSFTGLWMWLHMYFQSPSGWSLLFRFSYWKAKLPSLMSCTMSPSVPVRMYGNWPVMTIMNSMVATAKSSSSIARRSSE